MIGTVKRVILEEQISNESCPHCQESNALHTKVYSKVFVLRLFPFVYGKEATVDCLKCKKVFPNIYDLPDKLYDKVMDIVESAKHKWYSYIGYILFGGIFLYGILAQIVIFLTKPL